MSDFNALQLTNDNDTFATVQEKISAMNVSSVSTNVQQSPTPENGNTAICQTELIVEGKRTSMCGIATPDTSQSDKVHILLADALCSSMTLALNAIQPNAGSTSPFKESPFSSDESSVEVSSVSKFKGKHNPNKPISESQEKYIIGLAQKQGFTADTVANKVCKKELITCSSADADKIIQYLKA